VTRRCGCRRRRGPDCAAAAGIGVRTARHHFIDRCESTERCATDVVWCRWVAVTRISAPRKELSPASAGLFHASVSPRALCNQLCGSALGWRLAADDLAPRRQAPSDSLDQLSPVSERGFFSASPHRRMPGRDSAEAADSICWVHCDERMELARLIPRFQALPALLVFRCAALGRD
jgi:hypothetical protein